MISCVAQLAETASLGDAILGALQGQRRRLEHAAFSHDWADDDLHRSANLTHGMMQRILRRRAVYVGVALLLIVAIFFTIWFKATHAASGQ